MHSPYHPLMKEYTPQIPHTSSEDYMMAWHEVLLLLGQLQAPVVQKIGTVLSYGPVSSIDFRKI